MGYCQVLSEEPEKVPSLTSNKQKDAGLWYIQGTSVVTLLKVKGSGACLFFFPKRWPLSFKLNYKVQN